MKKVSNTKCIIFFVLCFYFAFGLTISASLIGIDSNRSHVTTDEVGTRISFDSEGNRYFEDIPEFEGSLIHDPNSPLNYMPFEWPAFVESDFTDFFQNYASGPSRITLQFGQGEESILTCNVVGVVLDKESEAYVPNAVICANDEIIVTTDENGRFQITNLPNGVYHFEISANEYTDSLYMNYLVEGRDGANIFTFYIDKNNPVYLNHRDFYRGEQSDPYEDQLKEKERQIAEESLLT